MQICEINKETIILQVLKLFGIWILTTQFEFWSRLSLWSTTATSFIFPSPVFGNTGIPHYRFDTFFNCIPFSDKTDTFLEGI